MAKNLPNNWLRDYYNYFYPCKSVIKWLSYGKKPSEYLQFREFCFIFENDAHSRYLSFLDSGDLRRELTRALPHKIDLGAVYSHCPKDRQKYNKTFKAEERELVFDIDLTDYDEIRKCCSDAKVCQCCWRWMTIAVRVLDRLLREHFGFKHLLWVFSGRRGVHCWVADQAARKLDNTGRAAVAEYLSLIGGTKKVKVGREFVHPMMQDAYSIIMASEEMNKLVIEQRWFESPETWTPILEMCEDRSMRELLMQEFEQVPTAELRWKLLKRHFDEGERKNTSKNLPKEAPEAAKNFLKNFVLQHAYPRLDVNVSTGTNHLLKSPFCVHPKTGKVAVPVNPDTIHLISIESLPTIGQLVEELQKLVAAEAEDTESKENAARPLYYKRSSLAPFVEAFEAFVEGAASA